MRTNARTWAALLLPLLPLHSEVIDRVAIVVGRHIVTLSHLETEVRVTAFLEGVTLTPEREALERKQAASRLIQQTLIRREIELTRFPMPKLEEAQPLLEQARAPHGENFARDLAAAGLREQDVADQLLWRLTLLRFVQYRFQPGINISGEDIQTYYEAQLPRWTAEGKAPPPLEATSKDIETILTQQRVDAALDRWLGEQRNQTVILYKLKGLEE